MRASGTGGSHTLSRETMTSDSGDNTRATSAALFRLLRELGIETRTVEHSAVATVAEAKAALGPIPGAHCKNLFLTDRRGRAWLVVAREDTPLDLRALAAAFGGARLSFATPALLADTLGVVPGAVSPFAVLNDPSRNVTVVLQRALLAEDTLNFHPLDNRLTTAIAPGDLMRFLETVAHTPLVLDL